LLSSGRRGPSGGCGRCGGWGRLVGASEVPCAVDDTFRFRGEEVEETTRQVEALVRASRALVHDRGSGGLPVVSHDNLLEAVGRRVCATELGRVQSNDKITCDVVLAACAQSDIIKGPPGVVKPFLEVGRNVSRSTPGNGVMATGMGTSVRVCCDMRKEERESDDWEGE